MTRDELRKFINGWGLPIVTMAGIFLIAVKAIVAGVLIYGIAMHIIGFIFLLAVYNPEFYEDALAKTEIELAQRVKRAKWRRFLMPATLILYMGVLYYRHRWYLFVLTALITAFAHVLAKTAHEDLKKELKENEMS